jgi:hypothetical protein
LPPIETDQATRRESFDSRRLFLAPLALWHAAEPALVLILSGQSNMAGYGKAAELSDEWRTPPPKVTLIHRGRTQALSTCSIGPEVTLVHADDR